MSLKYEPSSEPQVIANSRDPSEMEKRAFFNAIDTDHSGNPRTRI